MKSVTDLESQPTVPNVIWMDGWMDLLGEYGRDGDTVLICEQRLR